MKVIWSKIAPPAMFTAAGNLAIAGSEDFRNAMDMSKWNQVVQSSFEQGGPLGESLAQLDAVETVISSIDEVTTEPNWSNMYLTALLPFQATINSLYKNRTEKEKIIKHRAKAVKAVQIVRNSIDSAVFSIPSDVTKDLYFLESLVRDIVKQAQKSYITGAHNSSPGFAGLGSIKRETVKGSNNSYDFKNEKWRDDGDEIYTPQGFSPLRGENILYTDMIPPIDSTLTFNYIN